MCIWARCRRTSSSRFRTIRRLSFSSGLPPIRRRMRRPIRNGRASSLSAMRFRTKTLRSAKRCNGIFARASMTGADIREARERCTPLPRVAARVPDVDVRRLRHSDFANYQTLMRGLRSVRSSGMKLVIVSQLACVIAGAAILYELRGQGHGRVLVELFSLAGFSMLATASRGACSRARTPPPPSSRADGAGARDHSVPRRGRRGAHSRAGRRAARAAAHVVARTADHPRAQSTARSRAISRGGVGHRAGRGRHRRHGRRRRQDSRRRRHRRRQEAARHDDSHHRPRRWAA